MARHRNFLREAFLELEDIAVEHPRIRQRKAKGTGAREACTFRIEPALRAFLEEFAKTYGITFSFAMHRLLEAAVHQWWYDYTNGRVGGSLQIKGGDFEQMKEIYANCAASLSLDPDRVPTSGPFDHEHNPHLTEEDLFGGDT